MTATAARSGRPSTMPREPHCYDPTTPAYLDGNTLHLFSHADVRAGLLDDETLTRDLSEIGAPDAQSVTCRFTWGADSLTFSGAPGRHQLLRGVAEDLFRADAVEEMRPTLILAAQQAIFSALARGPGDEVEIDLYRDLAIPYSLRIASGVVGVTEDEGLWLIEQQRKLLESMAAWPPAAQPDTDAMLAGVHARTQSRGTVTERAVCAHARGDITEREAWAQTWGYVQAGVLTTASSATSMIGLLVEHDGRLHARDSAATSAVVDEAMRYAAVFPVVTKVARVPHQRAGFHLTPGTQVMLWLSAADRDVAINGPTGAAGPDPAAFVPTRTPNRTVALSAGRHYCIGARLARVQLAVLLDRLVAYGVDIELRPGWDRYIGIEDGYRTAPVLLRRNR